MWNSNDYGTHVGLAVAIVSLFAALAATTSTLIISSLALLSIFVSVMNIISYALMDAQNNCQGGMKYLGIAFEVASFLLSALSGIGGIAVGAWLSVLAGGAISGSVPACKTLTNV